MFAPLSQNPQVSGATSPFPHGSGLFLTFESPVRAVKTTQSGLRETALRQSGVTVTFTCEPVGERVHELSLHKAVEAEAELLLFAAARVQNVQTVVLPALRTGQGQPCAAVFALLASNEAA